MEIGNVRLVNIETEMRESYLDYAMSVIVSRALPDVRDGLKPVQRRIIYAMDEMNIRHDTPYRKSARVVGEVLGKYHPHGDSAVYEALVRMAQDFSMRVPLIDGQGNFGSIDDDPPAAMRYTEVRLSEIASELLADIDKNTVDFGDNFDGSQREPLVLPARFPNLLVNGSSGIAVGMATNIPPHNLAEVCDAAIYLIDHEDATVDDLMRFVKGPDFPTRGILVGTEGVKQAYATGRGRIVVRAKAHIEESRSGRAQIVITEIPYQVNKAALIAKIADLVKEKKIDGIAELRDESDRQGIRIVIEVGRGANPRALLNNLYKHTQLQTAFSINLLALVEGQPRVLTLKMMLQQYISHRFEIVRRRSEFDLQKARERAHILEGLKIALDNLDAVIKTIRESPNAEAARTRLMKQFGLTEIQAQAILDMQLRRLAALETKRILNELKETQKQIAYLEGLLANPKKIYGVLKEDLAAIKEKYGDPRRTVVQPDGNADFTVEDLIPSQRVVITLSQRGYIKRLPADTYRTQRRGGRGVTGMITREADAVQHITVADTHDSVLFFTNRGRVYQIKAHEIPELSRTGKGVPLINLVNIAPDEVATSLIAIRDFNAAENLLFVTRRGEVKRVGIQDFATVRSSGLNAMTIEPGDELCWVKLTNSSDDAMLISAGGKAVRFAMEDVRVSNRGSGGVRGMRLVGTDVLVGAEIVEPDAALLLITANGYGKRTLLRHFPAKGRGTQGVIALTTTQKTGPVAATCVVRDEDEVMVISSEGVVIRLPANSISLLGRHAQGVHVMRLGERDRVVSTTRIRANGEPNG
ncbi:MAG: DNA gyrase subunit A [Chloroflexota bacterium]|nr:DNA gyrase subunit A [Dehalococcoidia bacterium]MDW8252912.1 DNA gyrase subunit A [Chloroflexota bacterium]